MAKYTKFEVEIGTNGHIKYKGKIIAILSAWCRYEDLDADTLYNQIIRRNNEKDTNSIIIFIISIHAR